MRVIYIPKFSGNSSNDRFSNSIRFSPPLVISEEDLQKAVEIIRQALIDLDQVRLSSHFRFSFQTAHASLQLDEIPGEVESEKGFRDELSA